ncbi:MAG: sigma-70 family RNA polymerase sigma factor [Myxococcota bacterium]
MEAVESSLNRYRGVIWTLSYRMLGTRADADDIVQQTSVRALERPPSDLDRDLRPWLVRVAINLARDELRRRKQRAYVGPWLPEPLASLTSSTPGPDGEYERKERAGYAYLVTLEQLSPTARAVLLLRDVLDYSIRETSAALDISEANVKTSLHRARRTLAEAGLDDAERPPELKLQRERIQGLLLAVLRGDTDAVENLLHRSIKAVTDSAGAYHAARNVVVGPSKVARFMVGLVRQRRTIQSLRWIYVDADVGLEVAYEPEPNRLPPRAIVTFGFDRELRFTGVFSVVAPNKLPRPREGATSRP